MKALTWSFFGSAMLVAGCGLAHDVAVTSYDVAATSVHVATAPIKFVHRQIDKPSQQPPVSDVTNPGRTVATATPSKQQGIARASSSAPRSSNKSATARPKPSPVALQFPTAKAVPGKPGYVFSPSDPNKYVDVSGYAPGSKVKDPYSGKIFLVPSAVR